MNVKNELKKEIDLGIRKIYFSNYSRIVAIPKIFLKICGIKGLKLARIVLVQEGNSSYLKILPIQHTEVEN